MKKNVFMLLAVTALLLVGCSKMEQVYPVPGGELSEVPVELSGVINAGTRGAGPIAGINPSADLELSVFRADATSAMTYNTTFPRKLDGTLTTTGSVTMSPKQYYLVDGTRYTKFIAVYPRVADEKHKADANTVEYTIDGTTDIMTSTVVQGNKATTPPPSLAFTHKLTQVRVKVIADGTADELTAIPGIWGKVTGITLTNKAVTALVTLPDPNSGAASIAQKPSTTAAPLPLATTHSSGLAIPTNGTAVEFGYAMFLPVSSAGLELKITTETSGATPKTVTTDSTLSFVEGKVYTITIRFKASGGTEVVSVTGGGSMTEWQPATGGPIEEPLS
jgi:hypothetical protein